MLQLKNITKDYQSADLTVQALKGVSLNFRKNEFVSILGPSGCGKTTMLNIIGGLDHYTDGDLIIGGKSTKDFNERDWDAYRNHSIGFVFQSYHLIPHQTVLGNVEIALTIAGVSKEERRKRAVEALEKVGLKKEIRKKPNQLSGGQMQRVAIARALVNNPEILLADEPTGALDTVTSVQVMDILKEIAKDRLVIMVTHNPELAEQYSTRIVRMLDGEILSDSAPLSEKGAEALVHKEAEGETNNEKVKEKKPSMSLWTAFSLSLRNLFTKKGRTMLTSFAGSIGIIGIALIYAVSQGMTNYINFVQEETLASYPLTIQSEHTDMGSMLQSFIDSATSSGGHDDDGVYEKNALYTLVKTVNAQETRQNDLKSFRAYIESELEKSDEESRLKTALSGRQYTYDFDMLVYTKNVDGTIIQSDTGALIMEMMAKWLGTATIGDLFSSMQTFTSMSPMSSMMSSTGLWQEMLPGDDGKLINSFIEHQYDLIYGGYPTAYNQVLLVVDENNEIDDMTLYALGLKSEEEIDAIVDSALNKVELPEMDTRKWTFKEICEMQFRTVLNGACYQLDPTTGTYKDLRESEQGMKYLYDNGIDLQVSGIIRPKKDTLSPMLKGTIAYTYKLTEYIVENNKKSKAIEAQLATPNVDIFTGLPFEEGGSKMTAEEKQADFLKYVETLNEKGKAEAYVKVKSIMPKEQLDAAVEQAMSSMTKEQMVESMVQAMVAQTGMSEAQIRGYIEKMSEEDLTAMFTQAITEQVKAQYAAGVEAQLKALSVEQKAAAFDAELPTYTTEQCAIYYEEVLTFSTATYDSNLRTLGYIDLAVPSTVNLYASTFENKGVIEEEIDAYNKTVAKESQISYTDYVGLMMSSVTTIIDAVTYVLIAFVAVSLIVSSIMIGVITLISVQERIKEIGILRAIGASKRNVSSMFNAETVIIGFSSGLFGVLVTYLLCIPINAILHALTGIGNLSAVLPFPMAAILISISVLLTLIAGIIPSRSAAKKDPVVALRTE